MKIELNEYEHNCEDCGSYTGYNLLVNDTEVAAHDSHFGDGIGPWMGDPQELLEYTKRVLDAAGVGYEV